MDPLRRLLRTSIPLAVALGLIAVTAGPAAAVPEGWSDPEPVSGLTVVWLLVGIPVGLLLLVTLMVYLPAMVRGERVAPGSGRIEEQWIGGPRRGARELAGPDTESSEAGGARGSW